MNVLQCATYQHHMRANTEEPLTPHYFPDRPWAKVGADLFEHKGVHYLLCDYYSKYPEVTKLESLKSASAIVHF